MSPLIPPWCGTGVRHQEAEGLLASRFRAASTTYPEWWWRVRDLNPGPTDYDSAALTTELTRRRTHYFPRSRGRGQEKRLLLQHHRLVERAGRGVEQRVPAAPLQAHLLPDLGRVGLVEFLGARGKEGEPGREQGEVAPLRRRMHVVPVEAQAPV